MEIFLAVIIVVLLFFGFSKFPIYNKRIVNPIYEKDNIIIDLDDRYIDQEKHAEAIKQELASQGREVSYEGDRKFIIDGRSYSFMTWNADVAAVPVQRTVLTPEK